jgi:hypothetical protein
MTISAAHWYRTATEAARQRDWAAVLHILEMHRAEWPEEPAFLLNAAHWLRMAGPQWQLSDWDSVAKAALRFDDAPPPMEAWAGPARPALPPLVVTSPLPPQATGIADYTAELLPALAAHYRITLVSESRPIEGIAAANLSKVASFKRDFTNKLATTKHACYKQAQQPASKTSSTS